MSTPYVWPPGLPQIPERGFTESIGVSVLRTPMEAGPAKMRRRFKRPTVMQVSYLLSTAQVNTLETFVFTTLQGVYRFTFPHPRTGASVETRIVPGQDSTYYTISYAAPGYWKIGLQLEIMP